MVEPGGNPYAYPGAAAPVAAPPAPGAHRYPVEFTATAGEYFRIWIVNLALTILTLGIYSAWAKVRKKRYFYSHTLIDGECFEYRANPVAILKGRIIAVVLFAAYSFGGKVSPVLGRRVRCRAVLRGAVADGAFARVQRALLRVPQHLSAVPRHLFRRAHTDCCVRRAGGDFARPRLSLCQRAAGALHCAQS